MGLVRSLQPPDILLIHCNKGLNVYNFIANTSKQSTLSTPFWCLCQKLSLCLLYFNKTLLHKSPEWSSLVSGPRLNSSLPEAKNPGIFCGSATTFQYITTNSVNMNSFDLFFSNPHFKIRLSSFVTIVLCGNLFEHLTELTNKFSYSLNQSTQKLNWLD